MRSSTGHAALRPPPSNATSFSRHEPPPPRDRSPSCRVGLLAGALPAQADSRARASNVLDYGAVPDGKTLATAALQPAIDQCAKAGGGTVVVPSGTFLVHTVILRSGGALHLQQGAVILGDTDPKALSGAVS